MFSIVIPLYNKSVHIERTLHSVFAQTCQDYEIIIVDDGSTDGSAEIVESLADPRIRLIRQQNAGVSAARNVGIAAARGEYVALLDADDEWRPTYLATQAELIERYPECSVFAVGYEFHNDKGEVSPTIIRRLPFEGEDGVLTNYFEVASHSNPPLWTSAVVARKSAFEAVGGFPLGIASGEDLLTWARLACRFKIAYSKRVEAVFCQTASASNISKAEQRSGSEQFILDELLKLMRISSVDGIKEYVLRWYKIYCVLSIETFQNHRIPQLAIEAISKGGSLKVFIPLIIFGILPSRLSKQIFIKLRR